MPFGVKPSCIACKAVKTSIWRKSRNGEVLCNSCHTREHSHKSRSRSSSPSTSVLGLDTDPHDPSDPRSTGKPEDRVNGKATDGNGATEAGTANKGNNNLQPVRKSARLKPYRHRITATTKTLATKGKSRRVIFKKNPIKAPVPVSTVTTSDFIFHEGTYYQVGDVVSVMDEDDGIYYAQLRGFLQDQYCEKSAVITWLIPTTSSPPIGFDPSTFILGPEEDLPRKMSCFEYVSSAPSEYFKSMTAPYPTKPTKPDLGFVWTSMGPEIVVAPSMDEIFLGGVEAKEKAPKRRKETDHGQQHTTPVKKEKDRKERQINLERSLAKDLEKIERTDRAKRERKDRVKKDPDI